MRTRTRTMLAAVTLAAIPLFAGALQSDPGPAATDDDRALHFVEESSGPQWLLAHGYNLATARAVGRAVVRRTGSVLAGIRVAL